MASSRTEPSLEIDPIGFALTGDQIPMGDSSLVERLAAAGWHADRIAGFRDERLAAGLPWPVEVPSGLRQHGYAAHAAAVSRARELLGLGAMRSVPPAPDRAWTADERRLAADRPPHWG